MKKYCENPYCDAEATHKVLVSINTFSDGVRSLCMTCYEAYVWGVQHGKRIKKSLDFVI